MLADEALLIASSPLNKDAGEMVALVLRFILG